MDKDQSALSKFLEGTEPSKDIFEGVKESALEKSLEKEPEKVEEEKEEKLPFHKDPKIQRFIEKEISKRLPQKEERIESVPSKGDFKETIDAFAVVIGNDTPEKVNAIKNLEKAFISLDERSVKRAEERIEEIRRQEEEEEKQAVEELNNAFEFIEENYDVDLTSRRAEKLRTEFVSFVEKIAPKDRNGDVIDYPDMNSAWETFSEIKKSTSTPSRAKELASRSMTRSTENTSVAPKKMDWQAVDEFMDSLK